MVGLRGYCHVGLLLSVVRVFGEEVLGVLRERPRVLGVVVVGSLTTGILASV